MRLGFGASATGAVQLEKALAGWRIWRTIRGERRFMRHRLTASLPVDQRLIGVNGSAVPGRNIGRCNPDFAAASTGAQVAKP